MKHIISLIALLLVSIGAGAESAKSILDKAAKTVSNPGGVQAQFKISGELMNTSGTISVKGQKFQASTPQAIIWFDGKTQWTYMQQNDEVNISNPSESQLQALNPYRFINLYKQGYSLAQKTVGANYEVHLTTTDKKRQIQEMYITVSRKTYQPSQVRMRRNGKWTTIAISSLKTAQLSDAVFRFNAKDYPHAEIIDLR